MNEISREIYMYHTMNIGLVLFALILTIKIMIIDIVIMTMSTTTTMTISITTTWMRMIWRCQDLQTCKKWKVQALLHLRLLACSEDHN